MHRDSTSIPRLFRQCVFDSFSPYLSLSFYDQLNERVVVNGQSQPYLHIGHHILQGRVAKLKKPLAVVQRVKGQQQPQDVTMRIRTMIHEKYVFDTRGEIQIAREHSGRSGVLRAQRGTST